jgi:hypothetical protein
MMMKYVLLAFLVSISAAVATDDNAVNYSVEVPIQSEEQVVTTVETPTTEKIDEPSGNYVEKVVLGALDKVTARVSRLTAKVNEPVKFGTLTIVVKKCWLAAPEEKPETIAFLDISETKPGKSTTDIFSNWMFASNPSVITLEHPVYDIWVTHDSPDAPTGVQPINDEASKKLEALLDKLRELPED